MSAGALPAHSLGSAFDRTRNGLNIVRLGLALVVLLDHSLVLSGTADLQFHGVNPGLVAVFGFFGLSGFLLVGSASRQSPATYLRRRFARIFPAFWIVLVITAFVIVPAALLVADSWCGGSCYLSGQDGAVSYVWRNAALWIAQPGIAGTPDGIPVSGNWNGSLWTLVFEFLCYLGLLVLAAGGIIRKFERLAAVWLIAVLVGAVFTLVPVLRAEFTTFAHPFLTPPLYLVPVFLTGAVIGRGMGRLPDSGVVAASCLIVYVLALMVPIEAPAGVFGLSAGTLLAPLVVYPVVWVGCRLTLWQGLRRNDVSYGVYIYAFPVQQALLVVGVLKAGYPVYLAATLVLVALLAVGSWVLVERPAIRWGARPSRSQTHAAA